MRNKVLSDLGISEGVVAHRRIFLLSSISHDDNDQWALIPHWLFHYLHVLNIRPEHFLLILHSDWKSLAGLAKMSDWFREYGIVHTLFATDLYSSKSHLSLKYDLLNQHVSPNDWVMQVDGDEFLMFPQGKTAAEAMARLDTRRENVHYSLLIDRVAANGTLKPVQMHSPSIWRQFPRNCLVTCLLQQSDMRKVSAYRGYLRVNSGNHFVFGLNASAQAGLEKDPRSNRLFQDSVRQYVRDADFYKMPRWYNDPEIAMPAIRSTVEFATAFHIKWIHGVKDKLVRRHVTEPETSWAYSKVLSHIFWRDAFDRDMLLKLCRSKYLPGPAAPIRALTSWELMMFILNVKDHVLNRILESIPAEKQAEIMKFHFKAAIEGWVARDSLAATG